MATKKALAAILAAAVLVSVFEACGRSETSKPDVNKAPLAQDTGTETEEDKFKGIDFQGREIRIQTSVDETDATNANALIEGTGAENGDVANDAVYKRNTDVEELLNVRFKFTQSNETYNTGKEAVQKIIMSGEDVYDIIIQDLLCMAPLAIEGMFHDVSMQPMIEYDQKYWWTEYMRDLTLGNGGAMYILAGDYFMDILCSAHALYLNKQMLENLTGDANEIYSKVLDGTWTTDEFAVYEEMAYQDLNGDGRVNRGDKLGYTSIGMWGPGVPFYVCGDINWVTRDEDGSPHYTLDTDPRAVKTLEQCLKIFYNAGAYTKMNSIEDLRTNFIAGETLFVGYQRVGDFQYYRDTEFDVGVCPYPKLEAEQENYVTSTHDSTEIGVIPITVAEPDVISTVVEMLCRETMNTVLPAYYETSLKVKYARDDITSQMLDIIHDNLRKAFPQAYNAYLDFEMFYPIRNPLEKKSNDFASAAAKVTDSISAAIDGMVEEYMGNIR